MTRNLLPNGLRIGQRIIELNRMLKYRNVIVHGFDTDGLHDELVVGLIEIARRIATAEESS